jgi:tRNA A37 N6-isopentenylltransferase MiaA
MPHHEIVIVVDKTARSLVLKHNGKEYKLQSLALFGGDAKTQEIFVQMYGSSADAAWSFAQAWRIAMSEEGGPSLRSFFKQCAAHICKILNPDEYKRTVQAEELLNKWESTDQTKWGSWDTEDVLIDKQLSEEAKKRWN